MNNVLRSSHLKLPLAQLSLEPFLVSLQNWKCSASCSVWGEFLHNANAVFSSLINFNRMHSAKLGDILSGGLVAQTEDEIKA